MRKFSIEREIPAIGDAEPEEMRAVARRSNELLEPFRPDIQWIESYIATDKMYCVYLAEDEAVLDRYVGVRGFPADKVSEIRSILDPTADS